MSMNLPLPACLAANPTHPMTPALTLLWARHGANQGGRYPRAFPAPALLAAGMEVYFRRCREEHPAESFMHDLEVTYDLGDACAVVIHINLRRTRMNIRTSLRGDGFPRDVLQGLPVIQEALHMAQAMESLVPPVDDLVETPAPRP